MVHGLNFIRRTEGGGSALILGQRCGFWPFIQELCDAEVASALESEMERRALAAAPLFRRAAPLYVAGGFHPQDSQRSVNQYYWI
jgi:hypothetical protein